MNLIDKYAQYRNQYHTSARGYHQADQQPVHQGTIDIEPIVLTIIVIIIVAMSIVIIGG